MIDFNRLRVSEDVTSKLRTLKMRTGMTPNFICRLALCYSLEDKTTPDPKHYDETGQEFNRYTLTGKWDILFTALVKERCKIDNLGFEEHFYSQYRAHVNRGVDLIYTRVKGLRDIVDLIPKS